MPDIEQASTIPPVYAREWELFIESLRSVNETLRLQITLAAGMLAACIPLFNVMPAPKVSLFLTRCDNWVFLFALVSMIIAYVGLERHWNYDKLKAAPPRDIASLYAVISFKNRMLHYAASLLLACMVLTAVFILLEYKSESPQPISSVQQPYDKVCSSPRNQCFAPTQHA